MVTIADVARAAGVSRSTVSYALSGKRSISKETQDRVLRAVSALGFTVNAGARALATQRTMVLGLLLQFEPDEFGPAMLQYVLPMTEAARRHGFDTLLVTDRDQAAALERITESGMVDGVVLLDVTQDDERLPVLRRARQPGIVLGVPSDPIGLDVLDLDFSEAARLLVDHLVARGHRELILITPPKDLFIRGGAYAAWFRRAAIDRAASHGLPIHVHAGAADRDSAVPRATEILDAHPDATGIIVHNDTTIVRFPTVLAARQFTGRAAPEIVSLYPNDFARDFSLDYTFVDTVPDELARMAINALVDRVDQPTQRTPPLVRYAAPQLHINL